ncbi:hypothetical protein BC941DRAFT_409469 [Chlamydoabsidia padenii]|nr:hypothetical protein BC941DRAFT_409469 [Chlamydoabsidia padenii]
MSTDQKPNVTASANEQATAQEKTATSSAAPAALVKSDVVVDGEKVEEDSHKVFVGNLSFKTKEDGLVEFFETSGKVLEAKIITIRPHHRGRSAGYGFVTFATLEDSLKAAKELDKKELDGREINVEVARPKPVVIKPIVNSESEGEAVPQQQKRRARKNKTKKAASATNETETDQDNNTTITNDKKDKDTPATGEDELQSDNASVNSDASAARPRRPRRKNKSKSKKTPEVAAAIAERRRIKKELTEPSQTTLFVANIPYSSTDETLQEVFKNYKVKTAHVARMRNGRSKGYGFVDMESHDEQVKALENVKDVELEGRMIYLKVALSELSQETKVLNGDDIDKKDDPTPKNEEPAAKKEDAPIKNEDLVVKKEDTSVIKEEPTTK